MYTSCTETLNKQEQSAFVALLCSKNYDAVKTLAYNARNLKCFDADAQYFIALHYLNADDANLAKALLLNARKNASKEIQREACKKLIDISNSDAEKKSNIDTYKALFADDFCADLYNVQFLLQQKQYEQITNAINPLILQKHFEQIDDVANANATNLTSAQKNIQLDALNDILENFFVASITTQNKTFDALWDWIICKNITPHHAHFLAWWDALQDNAQNEALNFLQKDAQNASTKDIFANELFTAQKLFDILRFRIAVYNRNYALASRLHANIPLELVKNYSSLLSDCGKALLFSNFNKKDALAIFAPLAEELSIKNDAKDTSKEEFIAHFYTARLHDALGEYSSALTAFTRALQAAPTADNYDNALWYYFMTAKKISLTTVIQALKTYVASMNELEYFRDFFFALSSDLLTKQRWSDFIEVYSLIVPHSDRETLAQYSYISARLVEEGLAKNPTQQSDEDFVKNAYETAYKDGTGSLYYRVLSASKLQIPLEDVKNLGNVKSSLAQNSAQNANALIDDNLGAQNKDFEKLALGYAQFGFIEEIRPLVAKHYESISLDVACTLADYMYEYASTTPKLYADALRVVAYCAQNANATLTKNALEHLYPRPYYRDVTSACKRFNIAEYTLYGLLRTESFFDKDVASHAGAIGLAQIMPATGEDIAHRLKIKDYDLRDSETNITFGAYYLSTLIERFAGSTMSALFSYNAGPRAFSRWQKSGKDLPIDLFLETIPYAETRDYGRTVLSAACVYAYLYNDKSTHAIVQEIVR